MNEIINAETGEIMTEDKLELVALPPSAKMTRVSLVIPENTTYEEWEEIGKQLRYIEGATQWAIGDWLNFGERKYGEKYAQGIQETTGYGYSALSGQKWTASRFEFCRRRQNLSWTHHAEVARLAPFQQDKMLDKATAESWSTRDLRAQVAEEYPREKPQPETAKFFSWFHEEHVEAMLDGMQAIRNGVTVLLHDKRDPEVSKTILDSVWKLMRDICHDIEEVLGDGDE